MQSRALLSLFTLSAHLDIGLPSYISLQRSAIYCSSWHRWHLGCWTLYRVRNCTCPWYTPSTILGHISCGEPSAQRHALGSVPFLSAATFHCRTAGSGGLRYCRTLNCSDVAGEMTADVFAGSRSTYLQFGFFAVSPKPTSFFGVIKAPKYTNSLTTPKFLSPKAIQFVRLDLNYFQSFVRWPSAQLLPPELCRHRGRLLNSCRPCWYHRHKRGVVSACWRWCPSFVVL
jgi:hypothetical protein